MLSSTQFGAFLLSQELLLSKIQMLFILAKALNNDNLHKKYTKPSAKAFQTITNALADKHLELIRGIHPSNAFALMNKLRSTFAVVKSAVSSNAITEKLIDNVLTVNRNESGQITSLSHWMIILFEPNDCFMSMHN